MKNLRICLVLAAALVLSAACTREELPSSRDAEILRFEADWGEDPETRTILQSDGVSVWWSAAESINLFYADNYSGKFTSTNPSAAATTEFEGTLSKTSSSTSVQEPLYYWAVYPYSAQNSSNGTSVTLTVPSEQTGKAGSFADGMFPAIARSETHKLSFYHVCGGARFSVTSQNVLSITFQSIGGEAIAGKVQIEMGGDGKPVVKKVVSGSDKVTVTAPSGGFKTGSYYFVSLLPGTCSKGISITLNKANESATKSLSQSITVQRARFGKLDKVDSGLSYAGSQPGWYELPKMDIKKSGEYRVSASDATLYYAWHFCPDVKGPSGNNARNYTVCFGADEHCPVWVAAPRHAMYVGNSGRNDSYRVDPDIPSDIQYSSTKTGSGCNKGHMLGSAERTVSVATNKQVFFYSNIAPQLSSGFNTGGGGWNILEDYVDGQVCADTLYEVLGCYFQDYTDAYGKSQTAQRISYCGRTDVAMPTMFYYVLLRTKKGNSGKALKDCSASELKCVAFVRAHSNALKGQAVTSKELMSVSDLEKITGVTYFPNVPNAPKSSFSASDWGL